MKPAESTRGVVRRTFQPETPAPRPGAIEEALQQVRAMFHGAKPELVVINDPQRGTASTAILSRARDLAVPRKARLLIATGSHRFAPTTQGLFEAPLRQLGFDAIAWHDARSPELVDLGGWRAHPWLAAARTILAIGSVEPHYFAGYTGAHKTLTIGCAAYADIERNHAGAMNPACFPGQPGSSPVHQGVMTMLRALGSGRCLAALNLFQLGDEIFDAAGGPPAAALDALVPRVRQTYLRPIEKFADVVIARVTGPLACSFYQADKGIKNNEAAVRSGGVLILKADCPQGIGQDAFFQLLRQAPDHRSALALVQSRGYHLGDHKAVRLRHLTDPACRKVRLFIVSSGLTVADASLVGATKVASVEAALRAATSGEHSAFICDVTDAGNTCLEVAAP